MRLRVGELFAGYGGLGLEDGHVTDVGLTRNEQLKALGNGVVPQQAALAIRHLLDRTQHEGRRT